MEDTFKNPDQQASPEQSSATWRDGELLVVPRLIRLPPRCVICNATNATRELRQALSWHRGNLFWLVLGYFWLIWRIESTRKRAVVYLSLCRHHRSARRKRILAAVALLLLSLGAWILGLQFLFTQVRVDDYLGWISLSFVGGIAILILEVFFIFSCGRVLRPIKIDDEFAWLRGASPEFLAQFPQL